MDLRISPKFSLFILWGLKRSGNHAIVNWLRPQARFVFFNNIVPIAPILLKTRPLPPPACYETWLRERLNLRQRLIGPLRATKILSSIEDHELTWSPFVNEPSDTRNILLLRDPENLLASRIRKAFKIDHPAYAKSNDASMQRTTYLWKSYARECLGETNHLMNKIVIYFPRWFSDVDYRRAISDALGLTFSDSGFGVVTKHGGGSSFDTVAYDGDGGSMRVLERFRQMSDTERSLLDELMRDWELRDYAERVCESFGGEQFGV